MNPLSPEDFEDHVTDTLKLGLQTSLDNVAASYLAKDRANGLADPDGTSWVQLIAPADQNFYPGGTDLVVAWPSIEVAVVDTDAYEFDLAQRDAQMQINLIVQLWLKDVRFPVLNRMQKRYAAAVEDVLKQQGALGDCSIQRLRKAWRTNPELRDENDRIQTGVLLYFELLTALIRS